MTAFKNQTARVKKSAIAQTFISIVLFLLVSFTVSSKSLMSPAASPVITSATSAVGTIGVAFSYVITATGTIAPVTYYTSDFSGTNVGFLPPGLALNSATGIISGTPSGAGSYSFIIGINGTSGVEATKSINITINPPNNAWLLTGNLGTDTSINFIGTTDDHDVIFKRNGIRSGTLNSVITAFGVGAGALGGFSNTSIGANAGSKGTANTANGNTAVGADALQNNITGNSNTAIGDNSLVADSSGDENTGVGINSLYRNVSGVANVALGGNTLVNNTSSSNTAVGDEALYNNTSGTGNTGVGLGSLSNSHTGQYNTGLGILTNIADPATSYAIALGYKANAISNQFALSDSIHTIKAKGLPTGTGYVLTDVNGDGNLSLHPNAGGSGTAWNLLGNAGTDTSINFIGTTDDQDVVFKRGGLKAGFLGYSSGNTAWGVEAGFGSGGGTPPSGDNTAIGVRVLNKLGTIPGYGGSSNTGLGAFALQNSIAGEANTAIGSNSLQSSTTASYNTAVGITALQADTTGANNTSIGAFSLQSNITGNYNAALGYFALRTNKTGQYNTGIGAQADVSSSNLSYVIALGYNATATASNQLALSDNINTIKAKGIPTGTGYVLTDVNGDGNLSLQPSAGLTAAQLALLNAGIANSWNINGNAINSAATSFLGTTTNSSLRIRTNNVENMMIDSIGRVCIGITNVTDNNYKLYVEKGIRTRKVKVDLDAWADFVFDANYKLPSLTDVENYIQQNKHLPDVPSAIDVQKNGLDLGENQKVLLQKVEELTLYIIDQNKKIDAQNKETEEQNKKITQLQNQNDQLQQLKKEVDDLKILLQKKGNG